MRFLRSLVLVGSLALVAAAGVWASGGAVVKVEKTKIGKVITNSSLHTLYMFRADHGTTSACYGRCATTWPPLITKGKPVAGAGVKASLLGTTKRKDGKLQVTYKKHPLYTYVVDKKPGQTTGEGSKLFGAGWYALTPTGIVIDKD
jgi:predicted lipoprotein with Yx(FWY)xxD motif